MKENEMAKLINSDVLDILVKYNSSRNKPVEDLLELLFDIDVVYDEPDGDYHRHWDIHNVVKEIKIDDKTYYIRYEQAYSSGDSSPYDLGWEFDPQTVCFADKRVETREVVTYNW